MALDGHAFRLDESDGVNHECTWISGKNASIIINPGTAEVDQAHDIPI